MATVTTFLDAGTDATFDFSFWASAAAATGGTLTSDTGQSYTGPCSIKMVTGTFGNCTVTSPTGVLTDSGAQISFYLRISILPIANTVPIQIQQSGGASVWSLQLRSADGKFNQIPGGATNVTGTFIMPINTWVRVSVSYYITNSTTFQFKVYFNGILDSTANVGTMTRTSSNKFILNAASNQWNPGSSLWFDNIYTATGGASSSSQPDTGNILITAKRPNANGTTNGFTTQIGSGGSGYGSGHSPQVNERPLSQTNGWSVIGAGSAVAEEYNVENATTGDVNITGATIIDVGGWVFAKSLLAETGQLVLNGSNINISLTSTPTLFTAFAGSTSYPAGTGTDIGIISSTTVTTVSLYECGIQIAYTPAVASAVKQLAAMGVG